MNDHEGHCLPNDVELFAAQDDMAEFAIEHAADLIARDRASLPQFASLSVQSTASVRQTTKGAL